MMFALVRRTQALRGSTTASRLISTTFWSAVSEGLARGLLLIALVLVARRLGRDAYGQFGMIRSTIGMLGTLGGMGLGLTANRYVAEFRTSDKRVCGQVVGSSFVLAIVSGLIVGAGVFVASGPLATIFFRAPQLQAPLRVAAILLVFGAISGAQIGILQGLEAYRTLAVANLAQGLAATASIVVGAYWFGLDGALIGLLVYTVAGVAIMHYLLRTELRNQGIAVEYANLTATLPIFWRFSLPVMLAGMAIAPVKWLAEALVVRRVGFGELGIFHASMTIATMLVGAVSTINAPLISVTANGDRSSSPRIQYVSLYGSWYVMLGISLPFALFPPLASLLFGGKFAASQFYALNLLLLSYSALLMLFQGVLRIVALRGSMWFAFHTNLVEGIALIAGLMLLSDRGIVGLGTAYVASYAAKIAVSVPYLVQRRFLMPATLLDPWFLGTAILFGGLVILQLRQWI